MARASVIVLFACMAFAAACGGALAPESPPAPDASTADAADASSPDVALDALDAGASPPPIDCDHLPSCLDGGCDTTPPEAPALLAKGLQDVTGLASDGTNVFWASNEAVGAILECAASGCGGQPAVFASNQLNPLAIVLDGTTLYWLEGPNGTIARCPASGCNGAPTPLVTGLFNPWNTFGAGAGHIFFGVMGGPFVRCPETGCAGAPSVVSSLGVLDAVAVGGANVFWRDGKSGSVLACDAISCTTPTILATGQKLGRLAATACGAYWTDTANGTVLTCPPTGCGGVPTVLAGGEQLDGPIAVDATGVYWATNQGVLTCPLGGCAAPRLVASASGIQAIALDAANVYFATNGGHIGSTWSVWSVPK